MKKLVLILFLLPAILWSCQKDNLEMDTMLDELQLKSGGDDKDGRVCFEIQFPLTLIMPDDTEVSGDSKDELGEAIKEWHKTNKQEGKGNKKFEIKYPINVVFRDELIKIESSDQLDRVKKACGWDKDGEGKGGGDKDKTPCIEFIFPLNFTMADGSKIRGIDAKDLRVKMEAWMKAHPDVKERGVIDYPVTIIYKGEEYEVTSEEQMGHFKEACGSDKDDRKGSCVEYIYPLTYSMPDGTSLTVQNKREEAVVMKKWFEDNSDYQRQKPAFEFPVNVKFKNKELTLENENGLKRILEACKGGKEDSKKLCFEMVYPLTYVMPDKTSLEVGSKDEKERVFKRWYSANEKLKDKKPALQFPVMIKYAPTVRGGEERTVEIDSGKAYRRALADCSRQERR